MNLIINGFFDKLLFEIIDKVFEEFPVQYCVLTYEQQRFPVKKGIKVDFHAWKDLIREANYNVDWNSITPLDEELISSMKECEVTVLRMMDRLESVRPYSYSQRKRLYLRHLQYWNHIISTKQIDLLICSNIPHEVYDYVIYSLCKAKNIPTLVLFHQSQVKDSVWILDDIKTFLRTIRPKYSELLQKYKSTALEQIPLSERFLEEYNTQVNKSDKATPFYMRHGPLFNTFQNVAEKTKEEPNYLLKRLIGRDFWTNKIYELKKFLASRKILAYYDRKAEEPDLTKKYIYFPLHYQPELSTSPLAGCFVDQYLIARIVSASLPSNVRIYIKEHPMQRNLSRSKEFYQDLSELKNVYFAPRSFSSFQLTTKSIAVVTATGTVGWEALFRNKPVLMFGDYLFQFADGVFKINDLEGCKKAVDKIISGGEKPDLKRTRIFLKTLEELSIPGVMDPAYRRVSGLGPEESVAKIKDAVIAKIQELFPNK